MSKLPALSGLPLGALAEVLRPLPAFRARQIFQWISRGAAGFDAMTNLSLPLRLDLASRFSVRSSGAAEIQRDPDGTAKLRIALADGASVEAVLLSDGEGRQTACISTQVGCPMGCVFCKTGTLGFQRNLDAAEMVEQFLHLRALAPDLSHIVIMGMGEPLLNLDALRDFVAIITDPEGLHISRRRITLSTSGLVAGIRELADRGPDVRLAVSLTTADPELRSALMPVNRSDPLPLLKEALLHYQKTYEKRITLETVLLGGLNTRSEDADALAKFAQGLEAVINLIPWNPVEGLNILGQALREPSRREVERFAQDLQRRGLLATTRMRKGRGVSGACGQLGSLSNEEIDSESDD